MGARYLRAKHYQSLMVRYFPKVIVTAQENLIDAVSFGERLSVKLNRT